LADLGDQGLGLSHSTSISTLTPMTTAPGGSTHEATPESENNQHWVGDDLWSPYLSPPGLAL
jgi:hypothetical protein